MQSKAERGMNVNDIPGAASKTRNLKGGAQTSFERAVPIRPTIKDYDIINPYTAEGGARSQMGSR